MPGRVHERTLIGADRLERDPHPTHEPGRQGVEVEFVGVELLVGPGAEVERLERHGSATVEKGQQVDDLRERGEPSQRFKAPRSVGESRCCGTSEERVQRIDCGSAQVARSGTRQHDHSGLTE